MNTRWIVGLSLATLLALPMNAAGQEPAAPPAAAATTFTDAQLSAFANASAEIDALHRAQGGDASQAPNLMVTQEAGRILQRHNIDVPTYNAIAERARSDEALRERIGRLGDDARLTP